MKTKRKVARPRFPIGVAPIMRYAVIRRWKDNPRDFQVLEYMASKLEAAEYITAHPHHRGDYELEIAIWN